MKLKCLQDNCPETGQRVDMLRCCGEHSWSKPCKYYGSTPWSEFMFATCEHPEASIQALSRQGHTAEDLADDNTMLCYYDVKSQKVVLRSVGLTEFLKSVLDDNTIIHEIEQELVHCGILDR